MKNIQKKNLLKALKSAVQCIAFFSLLLFLVVKTYDALSWKDTLGDYISSVDQLYATEDDKIDVVFTGSSHTYCSIVPALIWDETGIAAFNMTTSGQDKDSTYHYLVELLKTQSPEVVFVELWGLTFDTHMVEGNIHRNMMGMPLSENSIALIDDYVTDEDMNISYKLRWPIVHTRYRELDMYDFVTYDFSQYGRGVDLMYNSVPAHVAIDGLTYFEADELSEKNQKWLDELYQLSKDEDFELVLFVAPTSVDILQQGQINGAAKYAEEHDITFFDFNRMINDVGIAYETDFIDYSHLNGYGAEKLTAYICDYLTENYDLEDHSKDKGYDQWNDSYTRYVQVREAAVLSQCQTFDAYVKQLKEMENITVIISFEGDYVETPSSQPQLISWMFGMDEKTFKEGGTYIYKNGKLKKVLDNESEEVYVQKLSKYNTLKIQNMELATDDIMINMETLGTTNDGVNFVVYDNFRNEVIDTRGFY